MTSVLFRSVAQAQGDYCYVGVLRPLNVSPVDAFADDYGNGRLVIHGSEDVGALAGQRYVLCLDFERSLENSPYGRTVAFPERVDDQM